MEKSPILFAESPNWYRKLEVRPQGDYFGSLSSLYPNEVFLTFDKKWVVTRNADGVVSVVQNVCLHAGGQLLSFAGTQQQHDNNIRCPLHQWLYDLEGNLLAAPKFCKSLRALPRPKFALWNGYIIGYSLEELRPLEGFGASLGLPADFLDAKNFGFRKEKRYDLPYPRALMKINYDDGLHVPRFHETTFGPMIDEGKYQWEFGPKDTNCSYSIQVVNVRPDLRAHVERLTRKKDKQTNFGWADFHFWLDKVMPDTKTPIDKNIFAVWASIYGNGYIMPELYEGGRFLALSYLVTDDDDRSGVDNHNYVEFYVHHSVPEHLREEALEKFIFAYEQSAREDDEICETLWAAHKRDISFKRIYHETLEAGEAHFREWFLNHFMK